MKIVHCNQAVNEVISNLIKWSIIAYEVHDAIVIQEISKKF